MKKTKKKQRAKAEIQLDGPAEKTFKEFAGKSPEQITTGSVQASFHEKERNAMRGTYSGTFPVVGIGASAGGVESFSELLSYLPIDTGMSFVLIQHLAPKHESLLPAILSRVSKMPVKRAETDMVAKPNHVYVIPPNTNMGLINGVIKLLPRLESPSRHMPVDFFMRCLADDQNHLAIGVILSGADSDGAQGMRAIRAQGGLTLVQDPRTAKVDGMPRNAIAAGGTDTILTIPDIAAELIRIANHPLASEAARNFAEPNDLVKIFQLLKKHTRTDFSRYKEGTILRRLRRRILLHQAEGLPDYVQLLRHNPEELDALGADFLINVTSFFRDGAVFEILKKQIFPQLFKSIDEDQAVRVWIPGCATGEEVYSMAIVLLEAMEEMGSYRPIQIFASDLSEPSLQKARDGFYNDSIMMDVSPERLRKYFIKVPTGYRVKPSLRELCIFARHDITQDPPFSRMNLISCRNLLIYLKTVEQQRVLSMFGYALRSFGYLLLGNSETTANTDCFDPVDKENRIFLRKAGLSRSRIDVQVAPVDIKFVPNKVHTKSPDPAMDLEREVTRILMERFVPVGVVVSASMQIVQFRGSTGDYLEPASGEASLNLLKMAKAGLDTELRILFKKCEKSGKPARKENISLRKSRERPEFAIEIIPLKLHEHAKYFLVLFDDCLKTNVRPAAIVRPPRTVDAKSRELEMERLKEELVSTREYLQSIIRDQDTSNEELQAANEEVLSSNEELQSTNEELETAKEELQSTNEELTTVNDELSQRNNLLLETNNDLNNLLVSVNIPIIIVGSDLRIRRFNPMVERVLNVISADVGRRISDINPNVNIPDLENLIAETIRSVQTMEREVQDRRGHWYSLRVRPYRTANNTVDGAVLIFVEIAGPVRSTALASPDSMETRSLEETITQPVIFLDGQMCVRTCNHAFASLFQIQERGILNINFFEILDSAWSTPMLKAMMAEVYAKNIHLDDYQFEREFPKIGRQMLLLNARRVERYHRPEVMLIIDNITPLTTT